MEKIEFVCSNQTCTGCTACFNICPKQAISMKKSSDGFLYPVIDKEKCINCGLCKKVCPVLNTKNNEVFNECFVGYAIEESIKYNSSSGGIFPLIASDILDNNGIVIGACFDGNKLKHVAITKKDELDSLKGSKYLQSDLGNIFSYIKRELQSKKILFVGTPCQVAGVRAFIKNDYNNLICIDLICHGVPSPKLFAKYVSELEAKNGKLQFYIFRDKSSGWKTYSNTMICEKNVISEIYFKNDYMKLFLSDIALRESCYNCNFKLGNKYSDITLGDFWGVENYYPEMYSDGGVSAIIVNTSTGKEIFDSIKERLYYKSCLLEEIVAGNASLIRSSIRPLNRDLFFKQLSKFSVSKLTKKYKKKTSLFRKVLLKFKLYNG